MSSKGSYRFIGPLLCFDTASQLIDGRPSAEPHRLRLPVENRIPFVSSTTPQISTRYHIPLCFYDSDDDDYIPGLDDCGELGYDLDIPRRAAVDDPEISEVEVLSIKTTTEKMTVNWHVYGFVLIAVCAIITQAYISGFV